MHVGDLVWVSQLAGGEFGAFLADVPSESRKGEEERDCGVKTEKFRGLSAKSVTQCNSAQWTAGCFRVLSGAFLQKTTARAAAGRPGRFRRCWAVVGRMCFFFFPEILLEFFLFNISMNSAVSFYFCEN